MSFGVKLILNIKIWQFYQKNPSISVKLNIFPKKLKQIPKKLKQITKKLNVPEENASPLLQKSAKKSLDYLATQNFFGSKVASYMIYFETA